MSLFAYNFAYFLIQCVSVLKCSSISVVNGPVRGTKDHVVGEERRGQEGGGGGGSREECD